MSKTTVGKISFAVLTLMACGEALAQELSDVQEDSITIPYTTTEGTRATFGSNLFREPCSTCKYDSSAPGYFLWGSENCTSPGRAEWLAVSFIASATGVPERISAGDHSY